MTTIFELVNDALATLSPIPFALKPFLSTGSLPDVFIDYQLIDGSPEQSADNAETERSYLVQVTTWSINGLVVLPDVASAMVAAGFQRSTERQLPKDGEHFGLAQDYVYF